MALKLDVVVFVDFKARSNQFLSMSLIPFYTLCSVFEFVLQLGINSKYTRKIPTTEYYQFHNSNFICSGSNDTTIRLWDIRKRGPIAKYLGHSKRINVLRCRSVVFCLVRDLISRSVYALID